VGWIAFFTAFIWLVHPIQTQSVSYIVQRMNSLAAMFYVLSFLLYARARLAEGKRKKLALFSGCILSGILALGSKEIAVTLPFSLLLYEWYFFQDLSWSWLKRHLALFVGILLLLLAVAFMYLGSNPLETILEGYNGRDFTLTQRVLTQFRVVILYISLLLFPHPTRLNLDYDFRLSHSLTDPITTLLAVGAIAGLIGLATFKAKKERLLSFCILWFLGHLVIESSVIALELVFEHRTYLPSMLVSLIAVALCYRYIKLKWLGAGLLSVVILVFSIWTYQRNGIWSDEVTLWSDCVEKSPKKARPHYNLGNALMRRGRLKDATSHYTEALRIKPDHAKAQYNLGVALAHQGKLKEAISHYTEALRIEPNHTKAHSNLGLALASQGRLNEAIRHFNEALRIRPGSAEIHINMGATLASQGRLKQAVSHYEKALRLKPDFAEAHNNLGAALAKQGNLEEAISHYTQALGINPNDAEAHYNLGNALMRQARLKEAINHYYETLRIKPDHAKARRQLDLSLRLTTKSTDASDTAARP
jgi:Flp pilus assembly protein TadD